VRQIGWWDLVVTWNLQIHTRWSHIWAPQCHTTFCLIPVVTLFVPIVYICYSVVIDCSDCVVRLVVGFSLLICCSI